MKNVVYHLLRQMRMPLIALIGAYAVSTLGFVLIPGADDQGEPWRMNFFHAFYFVSFMGSTIGFGEIPFPFTEPQRFWAIIAIYTTVIAWLYAIGNLLALIQDQAFRHLVSSTAFSRSVRRITDPFYLVCGYGDTGSLLVRELAHRYIQSVVIDINPERINALKIDDLPLYVPGLCANAADSAALAAAGLAHPQCAGVIALTNVDHTNLTIAITSKLLTPGLKVICRAETQDSQANMASFGTDHIINPFETFARRFATMFRSPSMYLVYEWMTSIWETPVKDFMRPPAGDWILCGYGRFGKAVQRHLTDEGLQTTIIEADTERTRAPEGTVHGRGTEAFTLLEADIENAKGIIAGTDDDANNLSIIITARDLNKGIFTVGRQNHRDNDAIFQAANINLVMQPGTIISQRILTLIMAPLLENFLRLASDEDDKWANILVSRVAGVLSEEPLDIWTITIADEHTPAVIGIMGEGAEMTLKRLTTDPRDRTAALPCVALLLKRDHAEILLPGEHSPLLAGDQLLFCGCSKAQTHMRWTARNLHALNYICTGMDRPSGAVWRWLYSERR
jgi:voltage-gated potassium channel